MKRGLAGCRVAVTRPAAGAGPLTALLEAAGAVPVVLPLVDIVPPRDAAPLRAAVASLADYAWIVFTSANAVRALGAVLSDAGVRPPPHARVAAVGPATAEAVRTELGWPVHAVPEHYSGDALVQAMETAGPVAGRRVLWPRAEVAREALPRDLDRAGAQVDAPVAYRTEPRPETARRLAQLLAGGELDVVILTSPSAVACLAAARPRPGAAVVCVIGSTTGAAARQHGLPVHVEPQEHTIPALVDSLQSYLSGR